MPWVLLGVGGFLIAVGAKGNTDGLLTELKGAKGVLIWVPAVVGLYVLAQIKPTRPIVAPLAGLTALAFFLNNEPAIAKQLTSIKAMTTTTTKKTGVL